MPDTALATAAAPPESHGSAIDGARYLALTLLQPSPTNPRTHFDEAYIKDLADSIKKVGVMQAIVVRPLPDARPGGPQFEIVAGECRWRASTLAGEIVIPALVRDLNALEVMEIQLLENLKRRDLHPLEEARGYHQMLLDPPGGPRRVRGYTIEQLADKVGVSTRQIYVTIQLLKLTPAGQQAMFDGRLTRSVGLLIARMPPECQAEALDDILRGWGGEPYSYRQAAEHLQRRYMLTLVKAPFDVKAADLVPAAGACTTCPKRSGANPDLFEDVQSADTCTDPGCFEAKKTASAARVIEDARAKGLQVFTGAQARRIMPHGEWSLEQNGYVRLDKAAEELTGSRKPLQALLGDDIEPLIVQTDTMDAPIAVVKVDQAKTVLKARGLLKPTSPSLPGQKAKPLTADDIKKQRTFRIRDMMEERAPAHLWKHLQGRSTVGLPGIAMIMLIGRLDDGLYTSAPTRLLDAAGLRQAGTSRPSADGLEKLLITQNDATLARLLLLYLMADTAENSADYLDLAAFGTAIEWPVSQLLAEITTEVDSAIRDEIEALKAPITPKPAAKKSPAKAPAAQISDEAAWPFPGDKQSRQAR